jgi:hypothetical protein
MNDFPDRSDLPELDRLPRETEPPPEVEDRIVNELTSRGLIGGKRHRATPHWWQIAAAALLAAALGWTGRGLIEPAAAPPVAEREFLLLLSEPEPLQTTKSEAELVDEYRSWAQNPGSRGRIVGAGKLESRGEHLRSTLRASIQGGREPLNSVTGYFLVRAASWEDALQIARGCPHLAYGGEISVRALEELGPAA